MTGPRLTSMALALAVSATVASAATWNTTTNNASWGMDANWMPAAVPASNADVEFNQNGIAGHRTVVLNGDQTVNSLTGKNLEASNYVFSFSPGTPAESALTILSGNITADAGSSGGSGERTPLRFGTATTSTPIVIGNNSNAVNAVWNIKTDSANGNSRGQARLDLGEIRAIQDTVITIKSEQNTTATTIGEGNSLHLFQSNDEFFGKIVVDEGLRFRILSYADNGLGKGTIEVKAPTAFVFSQDNHVEEADLFINHTDTTTFATGTGSTYPEDYLTLKGNLSGTGNITLGKRFTASTVWYNTIIHDGDSTLRGDVLVAGGYLRINGTWSGTGNVSVYQQYTNPGYNETGRQSIGLEGFGTLGLDADKTVTIRGNANNIGTNAKVIPGTDGEIGELTIGSHSDSNRLIFHEESQLRIDIDGAQADRLIVIGDLDLSRTTDSLIFNILTPPTSTLTLVTYTGTRTGEFNSVYYDGELILDPTAPGSIAGHYHLDYGDNAITLVPEPAALGLLSLGAIALLRRRR